MAWDKWNKEHKGNKFISPRLQGIQKDLDDRRAKKLGKTSKEYKDEGASYHEVQKAKGSGTLAKEHLRSIKSKKKFDFLSKSDKPGEYHTSTKKREEAGEFKR